MEQDHIDVFNSLNAAGNNLKQDAAKKRGEEFETLINDILESEDIILERSYRITQGVREQIDGAIKVDGRVILIEVKWVESGIAASELYSFMGKVDNKFDGTIGLFLSRAELSNSILLALNKGRRQRILVIHGEDFDLIFKHKVLFENYLIEAIHEMSIRNDSHLPVKKYLSRQQSQQKIQQAKRSVDVAVSDFVTNFLLNNNMTSIVLSTQYQTLSITERKSLFEFIVKQYPQFYEYRVDRDGHQLSLPNTIKNVNDLLDIYIKDDSIEQKISVELVKLYYSKFIIESAMYYHLSVLPEFFASSYKQLDEPTRTNIESKLVKRLKDVSGIYDAENELTDIIKPLWLHLKAETRKRLKPIYLDYFVSSREKRFPQVNFATLLLDEGVITREDINDWLVTRITENLESYKKLGIKNSIENIASSYSMFIKYFDIHFSNWPEYVKSLF